MSASKLFKEAKEKYQVLESMKRKRAMRIINNATNERYGIKALDIVKNKRKIINMLVKDQEEVNAQKNQKPVKSMTITIDWEIGSMRANQAKATAIITYQDGSIGYIETDRTEGYGYDKESTVLSRLFNDTLRYRLWDIETHIKKKEKAPYGINLNKGNTYIYNPSYSYGVGTSCYYDISEFIGGEFKHIVSSKTRYTFTMKK